MDRRTDVSIAILDFVFTVGVFGALGSGFSFSTGFIVTGAANSYYSTANGEHVFVYDGQGKLIYDLSADRVKAFNINVNPAGQEFYQLFKLDGAVPQFIKDLFGW